MTEPWIQASDTAHDLLPPMSALSSHELVGENDRAIPSSPARLMLIGVIASVLFHLIIVLIVAKVSRPRSLPIAEGPPTSVQIRITHTSRSPSSTENAEVPIIMDPGPDPMPASEAIVTSSDNDVLNVQEAPEPQEAPITLESARQRGSDERATTAEGPPTLTAPSRLDIRRAVRSASGGPSANPDLTCSPWMLRQDLFVNCDPNENLIDVERASRSAILTPLASAEADVETAAPSNATDTTQRMRSLLDRFDDRLGTSRTRRSIMQSP